MPKTQNKFFRHVALKYKKWFATHNLRIPKSGQNSSLLFNIPPTLNSSFHLITRKFVSNCTTSQLELCSQTSTNPLCYREHTQTQCPSYALNGDLLIDPLSFLVFIRVRIHTDFYKCLLDCMHLPFAYNYVSHIFSKSSNLVILKLHFCY